LVSLFPDEMAITKLVPEIAMLDRFPIRSSADAAKPKTTAAHNMYAWPCTVRASMPNAI
jgi:hypothetical protein